MGAVALEEVVEILYRVRSLHKCKLINGLWKQSAAVQPAAEAVCGQN